MNEAFIYKPGECNIDAKGVSYRRVLAYIAGIGGIIALGLSYYAGFSMPIRFIIGFLFGYATALNIMQVKEHFCVANATAGTQEINLKRLPVVDELYKKLDRQKRNTIVKRAVAIAIVCGCLGLIPV